MKVPAGFWTNPYKEEPQKQKQKNYFIDLCTNAPFFSTLSFVQFQNIFEQHAETAKKAKVTVKH